MTCLMICLRTALTINCLGEDGGVKRSHCKNCLCQILFHIFECCIARDCLK